MNEIKNISYGDKPMQKLDVYLPDCKTFQCVLRIHGGCLESGDKEVSPSMYEAFLNQGIGLISIDYSLYPDAKYPEFIEDAAKAVAWTYRNMSGYGGEGLYILGESAGAYIAMMLAADSQYFEKEGIEGNNISGYIFSGGQPTTHFNVLRELGLDERRVVSDDRAPLYHIKEGENYSPMLVVCASNDIENRYEQNLLFVSTLKHFGYDNVNYRLFKGFDHCAYHDTPEFLQMVTDFIRNTWDSNGK